MWIMAVPKGSHVHRWTTYGASKKQRAFNHAGIARRAKRILRVQTSNFSSEMIDWVQDLLLRFSAAVPLSWQDTSIHSAGMDTILVTACEKWQRGLEARNCASGIPRPNEEMLCHVVVFKPHVPRF